MKKIINYRWITIAIAAIMLIFTVLLKSYGRNGMSPWLATTLPASSRAAEDTAQNLSTKEETPSNPQEEPTSRSRRKETAGKWDVVVLGRIDTCYVCQRGSPHVSYTRVLAGKVPAGQAEGMLAVAGVAAHLLPEGGVPMYESQQEEIVFLKTVAVPGQENKVIYTVVDVMKATPQNLALFHDH